MTQQPWSEVLAHGIARELRRHRERRGISAQELADGCARRGMPIQRSVIANFENGRRASIGVAELLVFATVLQIPPVWLICPMGYEPSMEFLPGQEEDPYAVSGWIYGTRFPDDVDHGDYADNPVIHCENLAEVLALLSSVKDSVEKIKKEAAAAEPERRHFQLLYEQLQAEYSQLRAAQTGAIERATSSNAASPESDAAFKESGALLERMRSVSSQITKALEGTAEASVASAHLERCEADVLKYEREVREELQNFREKGWVPPRLPEEFSYLLEEPDEADAVSRTGRRRRKQSK